jgi:predicted transcriptional regulator
MTVNEDEIIERLLEVDDPAYFTREIADMFGYTTDGIRNRLDDLEKKGRIIRKSGGPKSTMWWLPKYDDVTDYPRSADSPQALEKSSSTDQNA